MIARIACIALLLAHSCTPALADIWVTPYMAVSATQPEDSDLNGYVAAGVVVKPMYPNRWTLGADQIRVSTKVIAPSGEQAYSVDFEYEFETLRWGL